MSSNANLHDDVGERVAKNPIKSERIHALIFQELQTHTCSGHKVMILATALTVNFPALAPGGPKWTIFSGRVSAQKTLLSFPDVPKSQTLIPLKSHKREVI